MIFVTVGTAISGGEFDRLIKKMDDIAPRLGEEILMQIGASKYIPENTKWVDYVSYEESLEYFKRSRLVVGHCGAGTMINVLSFGVPLIVIPRRFELAEHADDHQLEIAKFLEENNLAKVVYDVEELEEVIKQVLNNPSDIHGNCSFLRERLVSGIREFLNSLTK
jgi:beta-1,4-N-acetylglucosaminyltransferase